MRQIAILTEAQTISTTDHKVYDEVMVEEPFDEEDDERGAGGRRHDEDCRFSSSLELHLSWGDTWPTPSPEAVRIGRCG